MSSTTLTKTIANIISGNLLALSTKTGAPISDLVSPTNIISVARLFDEDKLNNQGLQKVLEFLAEHRDQPNLQAEEIAATHNWLQVSDEGALQSIVQTVITNNPKQVDEYKSGKTQIIGYLVGQCMKESKGTGNPKKFNELLAQALQ